MRARSLVTKLFFWISSRLSPRHFAVKKYDQPLSPHPNPLPNGEGVRSLKEKGVRKDQSRRVIIA
jgi:hypothetical protein